MKNSADHINVVKELQSNVVFGYTEQIKNSIYLSYIKKFLNYVVIIILNE